MRNSLTCMQSLQRVTMFSMKCTTAESCNRRTSYRAVCNSLREVGSGNHLCTTQARTFQRISGIKVGLARWPLHTHNPSLTRLWNTVITDMVLPLEAADVKRVKVALLFAWLQQLYIYIRLGRKPYTTGHKSSDNCLAEWESFS
ncbi:hypothetical protein CDAR_165961 [Caerostris darwini]|uniref:Uncharacterized protein n=1 Tax=Caerostris darwini TaxID=1538125 RepID=A0AAV4RVG7_9ARAC|nr:hypothetical protein CDAR_165961 [Caerostris darwini]